MGPTQTCSQAVLNHVFYSIWSFPSASILFFFFFLIRNVFPLMKEKYFFRSLNLCFYGPEFWMVEIISLKPCAPDLAYISGPILRILTKFRNDPHEERLQCAVTIHAGEES